MVLDCFTEKCTDVPGQDVILKEAYGVLFPLNTVITKEQMISREHWYDLIPPQTPASGLQADVCLDGQFHIWLMWRLKCQKYIDVRLL